MVNVPRLRVLLASLAALALATAPGAAQVGRGCSVFNQCPKKFSCQPFIQKCYNSPRQEGQPCSAGFECGPGLRCVPGSQKCVSTSAKPTGVIEQAVAGAGVVVNEAAKAAAPLGCLALVEAIKAGREIPQLASMMPDLPRTRADAHSRSRDPRLKQQVTDVALRALNGLPGGWPSEMRRVAGSAGRLNKGYLSGTLFDANMVCNGSGRDIGRLFDQMGLRPSFARGAGGGKTAASHFYMGLQVGFDAAAVVGGQIGLFAVTDFMGGGGFYWSVGPEIVTNVAGGVGVELIFFPYVQESDFEGWGWGAGFSAGPPTKIVSGAIDLMLNENWTEVQGFGLGAGVGLGVLPVDFNVSYTKSMRLR